MQKILIYGSYGYTGSLIVEEAISKDLKPIIAGRNEEALKSQAQKYELEYRSFSLNDHEKIVAALRDVEVVVHCAGPFRSTALPMAEACIQSKSHYIDITGEYDVFQKIKEKSVAARKAGVMLLPGAGFDVVPSDCLAKHLSNQLPDATHLLLAFRSEGGGVSRGTAKTMIEGSSEGQRFRKDGQLVTAPLAQNTLNINFEKSEQLCVAISWGDIVSAYHSTGIPNIEVYTGTTKKQVRQLRWANKLQWLLKFEIIKTFLKKQVDKRKPGPSSEKRRTTKTYLYGKVWNDKDQKEARLITSNGYTLTAKSAINIVQRILREDYKPGFQTPSTAYGEELILEIENTNFI